MWVTVCYGRRGSSSHTQSREIVLSSITEWIFQFHPTSCPRVWHGQEVGLRERRAQQKCWYSFFRVNVADVLSYYKVHLWLSLSFATLFTLRPTSWRFDVAISKEWCKHEARLRPMSEINFGPSHKSIGYIGVNSPRKDETGRRTCTACDNRLGVIYV